MPRSRAFSLIELLVVITVIATVTSISVPSLSHVVASRHTRRCEMNIRNASTLLGTYAAARCDALPFGPAVRTRLDRPPPSDFEWGGRVGLRNGTWSFLFPDEWSGSAWNASLRCPLQTPYNPAGGATFWESFPTPAYAMSEAVWLCGVSMTAGGPANWKLKRNTLAEVRFPNAKVYLTEWPGFCVQEKNSEADIALGQTLTQRVSMAFFDGSVRRARVSDGLPGAGGSLPVLWTVGGLTGRDFR